MNRLYVPFNAIKRDSMHFKCVVGVKKYKRSINKRKCIKCSENKITYLTFDLLLISSLPLTKTSNKNSIKYVLKS